MGLWAPVGGAGSYVGSRVLLGGVTMRGEWLGALRENEKGPCDGNGHRGLRRNLRMVGAWPAKHRRRLARKGGAQMRAARAEADRGRVPGARKRAEVCVFITWSGSCLGRVRAQPDRWGVVLWRVESALWGQWPRAALP